MTTENQKSEAKASVAHQSPWFSDWRRRDWRGVSIGLDLWHAGPPFADGKFDGQRRRRTRRRVAQRSVGLV